MINVHRLIAAAILWFSAPSIAAADVYLVTDIFVEVTAETSEDARAKAWDQARVEAAEVLMRRLTVYQDRADAGLIINSEIANRLTSAMDVQDEKQAGDYYRGLLSVKFQPAAVEAFLSVFNVPYVDSQEAKALILPNAGVGVEPEDWVDVWAGQSSDNTLAPYVGGLQNYPSMSRWEQIEPDAVAVGALRGVLVSASFAGSGYYIRMLEIAPGQSEQRPIGAVGPFASMEDARQSVIEYLENEWKARTIVRGDGETQMEAIARFNSRAGWIEIEKALTSSRLVENVEVEALSTSGADIKMVFVGRPDQLMADLRASGVVLDASEEGWLLQSALGR